MAGAGVLISLVIAVWVARMIVRALLERYPQFKPHLRRNPAIDWAAAPVEIEVWVIGPNSDSAEKRYPTPVALLIATRLSRVPLALRPFLSLWWLGHFAGGICCGFIAFHAVLRLLPNAVLPVTIALSLGCQLAFLFAVNLYLLMAVAVMWHKRRIHEAIWRWRFVVDAVLSLTVTLWWL